MAVAAGYFLAFYFGPLSRGGSPQGSLGATLRNAIPALAALVLAAKVRLEDFRRVYIILAAGFGMGGLSSLLASWLQGVPRPQGPWLVAWALPLLAVVAAAWRPQAAELSAPRPEQGKRQPQWLAPLAIALPPLVDLATRISGLFPDGVEARTMLTLACTLVLVVLCAMRVHPRAMVLPAAQGWDDRGPATASESLEFASGVAHELNNPLMAVAGWAEVALKKGAPEVPMHQLIEATRAAADAVARLDQITRGPTGTRE